MDNSFKSALKPEEKAVCDLNQNACDDVVIKPEKTPSNFLSRLSGLLPSNYLNLPPRWQNWFVRGQSGLLLISCFYTLVSFGPMGLFALTILVQVSSYYELMRLGQTVTKVDHLSTWVWLIFAIGNFYYLDPLVAGRMPLDDKQRLGLCFLCYLGMVSWFVVSIRHTSQCLSRYCLLAWSHLATFYIAGAGHLMNMTLRHGMVWYIFSMSIITINDIAAYMCGFFIGSTPLIVLSPKKTIEGYVGGALVTILAAPMFANYLQQYPHLALSFPDNTAIFPPEFFSGVWSPFVTHCLVISIFASTFGPVAGFFCSGFKRACNQKNFGCLIPGHGGVLDRCDCMFLMAVFTYVYLNNFVIT